MNKRTAQQRATLEIQVPKDAKHLAPFNVLPGDILKLELAHMSELRDGELLAVYDKDKRLTIARCINNFGDERDEKGFGLEYATGGALWCPKDEYFPFRVLTITRTFKPDVPPVQPPPSEKQEQLAELRARLERLDEQDEITTCTARFQLEKRIYDLEHSLDADEWPDLIDDKGVL
jgi:hypothetical protein